MPKTEAECFGMFSRRVYIMRADCCNAAMSTERKPERGEGRGQTEENVWARRNDATKKYAMRAEREDIAREG